MLLIFKMVPKSIFSKTHSPYMQQPYVFCIKHYEFLYKVKKAQGLN